MGIDPSLVLNPNLTIAEGGIRPFNRINQESWWLKRLAAVGEKQGFFHSYPHPRSVGRSHSKDSVWHRKEKYTVAVGGHGKGVMGDLSVNFTEGVIPTLERRHRESDRILLKRYRTLLCVCMNVKSYHGARLKPCRFSGDRFHGLSIALLTRALWMSMLRLKF